MSDPITTLCLRKLEKEEHALTKEENSIYGWGVISSVALFILSIPGCTGLFAGSTMGGLAIGLGCVGLACNLVAVGTFKGREIVFLTGLWRTLIPIALGCLGVMGVLSGAEVGLGVAGVLLTVVFVYRAFLCHARYSARNSSALEMKELENMHKQPSK